MLARPSADKSVSVTELPVRSGIQSPPSIVR
ncbi:MAG: hypothetical protein QOI78_893 [Actinomycetota bacterium]|nr:hypothetical protein [Actinomycetota bacterium]